MLTATPLVHRSLAVITTTVLVAGLVTAAAQGSRQGAAGSAPPKPAAARPTSRATTPLPVPTPAPASSPTDGASPTSGPPTTGPGSARPVAPAPAGATPLSPSGGPGGDPGQPTATAPGAYLYDVSSSGGRDGAYSGIMTERVATVSTAGGMTRQSVVDSEPGAPGSGSANQGDNTQDVEWGPQGYSQLATTLTPAGQTLHCTWTPPILELKAPLTTGTRWSLAGSCQVTVIGQPANVQLSGQAVVTGARQVRVGADLVPVLVVSDTYTIVARIAPVGATITIHQVATDTVAPRLGLIVEEDATDTFTFGTRSGTTHNREVLRSIHPS